MRSLKAGEIRGVQSAGMLLSYREMGLGEDHTGIADLPADAPVGKSYARWAGLDDPVIEIAVTPNRGDALAVRGVARDLAAAGLGALKPWDAPPVPARFVGGTRWEIAWPEACPWVLGRTIRDVRNGPSPAWLRNRLLAIGLRPINALVDTTNFFTVDLGRPLHVFDADKLTGDVLTMRPAQAGERLLALNGREYSPDSRGLRNRRRGGRAVARRRDRRRGDRLRREDEERVHRVRPVRSGARRADRATAPDRIRRPPALRARASIRHCCRRPRKRPRG